MDQANFTVSPFLANGHGATAPFNQDEGTQPPTTAPNGTGYGSVNGTDGATKCHQYINRLQETEVNNGGIELTGHAKELCVNKVGHTMVTPREGGTSTGRFRELFNRNRLKTVTYCAVFWSFGMGIAFLGPTLLDLECRIESEFSNMSWVFFSQSLFTLLGTACGGFMAQRLGSHMVLLVAVSILCLTLSIVPECTVLYALTGTLAVMGLFMGTIDTVANISMIQLYGRDVAPFLQALHFCYGLGAFLSPMVTKPFLLNEDCNNLVLNSTDTHRMLDIKGANISAQATRQLQSAQNNSKIQYAFWIMSAMQVPVIVLLSVLVYRDFFAKGNTVPEDLSVHPKVVVIETDGGTSDGLTGARSIAPVMRDTEDRPSVTKRQIVLVTICAAGLLFIYDGLQTAFGGYIYSYAVKSIDNMAQNEAAYLNACFWGTFAFGRLLSIGIATRITPPWMLLANLTGCLVAMVMMLSLPHNHAMLYIGTALFGTFMSSVFPTTISMTETYINVTSQITSILVMTAASGEMILPVIIGHEFDVAGPKILLVSGVVLTVAAFALYLALYIVADGITRISCFVKRGETRTRLDRGRSQMRSRMSSAVVQHTRHRAHEGPDCTGEKNSSKDKEESHEKEQGSICNKLESPKVKHEIVNENHESFENQNREKQEKPVEDQDSPVEKCEKSTEKKESSTEKEKSIATNDEKLISNESNSVNDESNSPNDESNSVNDVENSANKDENLAIEEEGTGNREKKSADLFDNFQRKHDNINNQESPEHLQMTLEKTRRLHEDKIERQ